MLERIRIFGLPSKPVKKLKELPQDSGIYYLTAFWIVLYVGKTKNLCNRWKTSHHRHQQLRLLHPFGRLHYKVLSINQISSYEKAEIDRLRPAWNRTALNPSLWTLLSLFVAVWGRVIVYALLISLVIATFIYLLMH